jgi:hypothetical protein
VVGRAFGAVSRRCRRSWAPGAAAPAVSLDDARSLQRHRHLVLVSGWCPLCTPLPVSLFLCAELLIGCHSCRFDFGLAVEIWLTKQLDCKALER